MRIEREKGSMQFARIRFEPCICAVWLTTTNHGDVKTDVNTIGIDCYAKDKRKAGLTETGTK